MKKPRNVRKITDFVRKQFFIGKTSYEINLLKLSKLLVKKHGCFKKNVWPILTKGCPGSNSILGKITWHLLSYYQENTKKLPLSYQEIAKKLITKTTLCTALISYNVKYKPTSENHENDM